MKSFMILIAAVALMAGLFLPTPLVVEGAEDWVGVVIGPGVNVRTEPDLDSEIVMTLSPGELVAVVGEVKGQAVMGDYTTWYQTPSGYYVYARYVQKRNGANVIAGAVQSQGFSGRWLDADLSKQVLTAMEGDEPVYGAEITVGRVGWETPPGNYTILRKVYNETMDSATIGIPRDSPDGYYLTNVLYTQYYTDRGHAIHYNYWVDPAAFGTQQTSRGCIGLQLGDAEYFWNFTVEGTPLVIHQ